MRHPLIELFAFTVCFKCWRTIEWLTLSSLAISHRASLVAQMVKHLPTMRETWVRSLGRKDPLEKEMATHSSVLAWRIPGTVEPDGLPSMGSHRVRHDWSDLAAAAAVFFTVQLSHPYMTTGKTIALTRRNLVGKVMSLLFNMLSKLVTTFLPRSKCLLISWLQSPSAVILKPKKVKFLCFYCFPIYLLWSEGTGSHDVSFLNVEF